MKIGKAALATAAAACLALVGCGSGGNSAQGSRTLTIGALQEPTSWDPAQAHVGHSLQTYQPVYDTLILREPEGKLSPMLATEWTYNDARTELTLDLRTDVTFSDGTAFNAEAVKANMNHFKTANGRQAAQLAAVRSVDVVDGDTVKINLVAPEPALEYFLSQAAGLMGNPKAIADNSIAKTPAGTGPYELVAAETVAGSQITYAARKNYWNKDLQKFDKIVFKVMADVTARLNAALSGQVDATTLDASTAEQAERNGLSILKDYQVDWTGLMLLDRGGKLVPAMKDVRVRQAINLAVDRKTLLSQIQRGRGTVTNQVFGRKSGAYVEDLDNTYPFDQAKARQLLAEAGYASGFDLPAPVIAGFEPIHAALAQQLGEVGIRLKLTTTSGPNYVADITAGKFPVAYFNLFQGEPWVAIKQLVTIDATYNPFDSTAPELQTMIDAVQRGGERSAELAKEVNRYVTQNAWFLPLYRIDQIHVVNTKKVTTVAQIQQAVPSIYNYAPAA
jgi:peptide/nickel transport system substrate-binding protein